MTPVVLVVARYLVSWLGVILVTRFGIPLDDAASANLTEYLVTIFGGLTSAAALLYGMWREPSAKGMEIAHEVDSGKAIVTETPPTQPNMILRQPGM